MMVSEVVVANVHEIDDKPIAMVNGSAFTELPKDLYIPPDALEVFLEMFEGPLDLLLYLIRRQNLDILNIPVAQITRQYMQYVDIMKDLHLELAGEYLVMAAMLTEIKSRMLLPRSVEVIEEDDPRAELVRRLQEYERFKKAAEDLDGLPRVGRDIFVVEPVMVEHNIARKHPDVDLQDVLDALKDVLKRAEMFTSHQVKKETLSVREKMSHVLSRVNSEGFLDFCSLFFIEEGRRGIVVTFLAVLELLKSAMIELVQNTPYGPIHIKAVSPSESP